MADPFQEAAHVVGREEPERVLVRPGFDGGQDFFGFGGREDEHEVFGRFFDDFE